MTDAVIAIDLGGTRIRTALVDAGYRIVARHEEATLPERGPEDLVGRVAAAAARLTAEHAVTPAQVVGVSALGPLDARRGVIVSAPNLPGWRDVPFGAMLSSALDRQVVTGNDANVAALAEQRLGAGRGHDNVLYLTVSTGVGGGVIANGRLVEGQGFGGEVGHMTVDPDGPVCNCGNRGCLEALASGTAIARRACAMVEAGARTAIAELARGDVAAIDARLVHQAARQGDVVAIDIFRQAGVALGTAIASLMYLLNPSIVIMGGSVMLAGDLLQVPMNATLRKRVPALYWETCPIVPAALGADVGLIGAAIVARDRLAQE
ncbi:MAG: ROK family protein [Anaerolineae bacterium]|nr:ROK family protein [Anaerolineae bacterium]